MKQISGIMVFQAPFLLLEMLICMCQSSRLTYVLALNCMVGVLETLYTAYYAIGLLAYSVALISYLPFIVSFVRMAWHDSETRRLVFYRNSFYLWMMTLAIDIWIIFNLEANIDELSEIIGLMPDQQVIADYFGVENVTADNMLTICTLKIRLHRSIAIGCYHLQYAAMVYVSKRYW